MPNSDSVLVISPTHRDRRELLRQNIPHNLLFDAYTSEELEKYVYEEGEGSSEEIELLIDEILEKYRDAPIAGIISSDDYPGSIIAAIVAKAKKLPAPDPHALLTCQHKYYSRIAQQQIVPEAVPQFALVDPSQQDSEPFPLAFPCFLKPVKSYFSLFAEKVHSHEELRKVAPRSLPCPAFLNPLNQLLKRYSTFELSANYLIAEDLLSGRQATIEGYAYNGTYGFMGVVDSIMYADTICFKQFNYPSALPLGVQNRAEDIAVRCMKHIGFDNGVFNIEFFYNHLYDSIHIIEINPRMASQFADIYEKVDGTNTYEVAVAIATGKPPVVKKRQGAYAMAASCVLREFSNKKVKKVPAPDVIKEVQARYPGTVVEVLVSEGKRLSQELQDGKSYRYGLVQLGAHNHQDLENTLTHCQQLLDFQFE